MDMTGFAAFSKQVESEGLRQHPSEIHGLITGLICAGVRLSGADRAATLSGLLAESLAEWRDAELGEGTLQALDRVFDETAGGLVDDEFGFRLLVPDDDVPVGERVAAVSLWCAGFLSGFGMSGRYRENELSEDLREVFSDLSRISSFSEEVPEDDDNEADLIEIGEYVRMSALLVYTECAEKAVH